MPVSFDSNGSRQTFFSRPANTTANTVYTCALGVGDTATLEAVNIATTGASNVTVWINNGTTDYLQMDAVVMAANTQVLHTFGNPVLRDGWSVKVMTSNADDATFTVVMAEQIR
jgi:O-glycosyl hydrolase